jgi:hypothetical protein
LNSKTSMPRLPIILISIALLSLCFDLIIVAEASETDPIKARVDRLVQVELDGALIIEDRVSLHAEQGEGVSHITHLTMGLPPKLHNKIFYLHAYDALGELNTTRDIDLDGFYGIDIRFGRTIDLDKEGSYEFNVVYILSGLVSYFVEFNVSFPLYPILEHEIDLYNLTVVLPARTLSTASSPKFTNMSKTIGLYSHQVLNLTESNIVRLANGSSWIAFDHSGFPELFVLADLKQLVREIELDPWGGLEVSDFYYFISKEETLTKMSVFVPTNATDISVLDVYGPLTVLDKVDQDSVKLVSVNLRETLSRNGKTKLTVKYKLPPSRYVKQNSFEAYTLMADFLNLINRTANEMVVKVVLPEGAKIQADSEGGNIYRSEVTNASRFSNMSINLGYWYNILWSSFRPVTWSGVSSAILCAAIFLVGGRAKPAAAAIAPVATEAFRDFVNSYEERMRIVTELRSMERQVRRGRLSRRRYRARRASLDNRLRRLHKELTDLRSKIADAGRTYADLMQRLEVAETELETLDENIRRVEARYRRGEISAEARQRLLDEYNSRRERAESTISQVTLRLREEL